MFLNKPYFRPGAGSVIFNSQGEVLTFERADLPGVWQLQQGGMDQGEEPIDTLWREIAEETGLLPDEFSSVIEYPHWTIYAYPPDVRVRFGRSNTLGQVHRWFFLKLRDNVTIDLARATDKEFINWRWSSFTDLIAITGSIKHDIYQELYDFYRQTIQTN